jgi:C4-dicarboxylate-specific signal transduction histidine kinase
VIHEARHPTSAIGADLISLKKRVGKKWSSGIENSVQEELVKQFDEDLGYVSSLESLYRRMDPFLRIRRKRPQEYKLTAPLTKSLLLFKNRIYNAKVKIEHDADNAVLLSGVEEDIITAATNILDNALYWLSTREVSNPYINISYKNNKDSDLIFISDNAGGISDNYKDSIFNVGFSGKENGTGLGLSIARESLGRANAQIIHENTDDGSVFTIEIIKGL